MGDKRLGSSQIAMKESCLDGAAVLGESCSVPREEAFEKICRQSVGSLQLDNCVGIGCRQSRSERQREAAVANIPVDGYAYTGKCKIAPQVGDLYTRATEAILVVREAALEKVGVHITW